MRRVRFWSVLVMILLVVLAALPASAAQTYSGGVRVVYVVPADREPHADYRERLDYLFRLIQDFFRRRMAEAGYVGEDGKGKTFSFETEADGRLKVHLLDHRPEGNFPDPTLDHAFYQRNPWHIDTEMAQHLGLHISDGAVTVRITDMSFINARQQIELAPNCGIGGDESGWIHESDHIFGNDIQYSTLPYVPLLFHTIGLDDEEQTRIFNDIRFTNIHGGGPYFRPEPQRWRDGEWPDFQNSQVWEYATIFIGAMMHELGHGFGLHHCFVPSFALDRATYGDFQLMGNGFRGIFASLLPQVKFDVRHHYTRHDRSQTLDVVFGTPIRLHRGQLANLNLHPLFNQNRPRSDRSPPRTVRAFVGVYPRVSRNLPEDADRVTVTFDVADDLGSEPRSGVSHVNVLMDANLREYVAVSPEPAQQQVRRQAEIRVQPGEDRQQVFSPGLHSISFEVVDREGNKSKDCPWTQFISVRDRRLEHWMIYDEWFVGRGSTCRDMLETSYLSQPDSVITPWKAEGGIQAGWRRFECGPFVHFSAKAPEFFTIWPRSGNRVAYAATIIEPLQEIDAVLRVGNDDYVQVYLNGKQVLLENVEKDPHDPFDAARFHAVPVHLKAGKNLLLVKVLDVIGGSGFHVWFEDPSGNPLEVKNELP